MQNIIMVSNSAKPFAITFAHDSTVDKNNMNTLTVFQTSETISLSVIKEHFYFYFLLQHFLCQKQDN